MLELERGDGDFAGGELIKDVLGIVGAVVVSDPGMIASDDEMRDAVVLSYQSVEDRLARTGVAHGPRHDREHGASGDEVFFDDHLVATHSHFGGNIARLGLPHQGMNEQAITYLQGAFAQIFMRPVNGVAGLEGGDRLPAALGECGPGCRGSQSMFGKLLARLLFGGDSNDIDRPPDQPFTLFQDGLNPRMGLILGAKDVGDLQFLIVRIDFLDVDHRQEGAIGMFQRGPAPLVKPGLRLVIHGQSDGNRPDDTLAPGWG